MCLVVLGLVMLCLLDSPGRIVLFSSKEEMADVGVKVDGGGVWKWEEWMQEKLWLGYNT